MQNNDSIGLIGAGQLAMLTALVAKKYNIQIECLDENTNSPASKYCNILPGKYNDEKQLKLLFNNNKFISYEFENINLNILNKIQKIYPNKCLQGIYPLFLTNNRIREKINLRNLNIETNKFSIIKNYEEIFYFLDLYNSALVIKTAQFGYDGKGQVIIKDKNDVINIKKAKILIQENECIVEEFIDFEYEISLTGVYYGNNKFNFLPINKNLHQKGILFLSETFLNPKLQKDSEEIFKKLAIGINKKTIYTIEFFVTKNNKLFVNEIAPRVHNSSHHGIDNYNISQYDLFLSLFFELKLPKFKILNNHVLINVLGQHYKKIKKEYQNDNIIFYDYYKKEIKENRKMGHLIIDKSKSQLINKYKEWCKI